MQPNRAITIVEPGVIPTPTVVPTPGPGADEVRIRIDACGVCYADQGVIVGGQGGAFPATPGHEIAGRVDAIGDRVEGWTPGDRVALGWFGGSCGRCDACRCGDVVQCPQRRTPGGRDDAHGSCPVPDGAAHLTAARAINQPAGPAGRVSGALGVGS